MTKKEILETIQSRLYSNDGDAFDFIDWIREFVNEQIG